MIHQRERGRAASAAAAGVRRVRAVRAARSPKPGAAPRDEIGLVPSVDLPRHVAIIMDGNRRWARERGVPEAEGHAAGVEAIRPIVSQAVRRGVEVLSIYAFSRENWSRSSEPPTNRPMRPMSWLPRNVGRS